MEIQYTINQLLARATDDLRVSSSTPRLDAELLLAAVLGMSRAGLLAEGRQMVEAPQLAAFLALVARRANLEPIAYLLGEREFYGLRMMVTPAVLVPRPETELLVETVLTWAASRAPQWIVDVGTGSGCIAVALAYHLPTVQVLAVDRSPEALQVAAHNSRLHRVDQRLHLVEGDLLEPLTEAVDLIVSNPPYTILADIDENVRRHEPHLALDGGPDGLDLYRRLLAQAPAKVRPGGLVALEIGDTQAAAVVALAQQHFPNAPIRVLPDLAGFDRVVVIETEPI